MGFLFLLSFCCETRVASYTPCMLCGVFAFANICVFTYQKKTYIYIYIFDRLQRYIFLRHYIWCENLENVMPMLEKIAKIMNNHPWYFPAWSYNRSEDTHNPPNSHSYYWLRAFRIPIKGLFYAFWFQGKCFSQKKDVERGYFKDVLIMFGCYIFRRAPEKVRHGMYIFILLKISQSHVFETQKTT